MKQLASSQFNDAAGEIASDLGIDRAIWMPLKRPLSLDHYQQWLDEGLHADMNWLADHLQAKGDPEKILAGARSVIVTIKSYVPAHPWPHPHFEDCQVAKYAKGTDYHLAFRHLLEQLAQKAHVNSPQSQFIAMTDSFPVLERDLAYQAGLGWIGKNSCLISRDQGSFFLIGEIYSTLEVEDFTITPVSDFCGTCTRCIDACPTDALIEPRKLDSNRCISYWTIEAKDVAPIELRNQFDGWLFGCDICQDVCPWNVKLSHPTNHPTRDSEIQQLREILVSSGKSLQKKLEKTPLSRAAGKKLKRNALIVIGNKKLQALEPEVIGYLKHPDLSDLAKWTLHQLNPNSPDT